MLQKTGLFQTDPLLWSQTDLRHQDRGLEMAGLTHVTPLNPLGKEEVSQIRGEGKPKEIIPPSPEIHSYDTSSWVSFQRFLSDMKNEILTSDLPWAERHSLPAVWKQEGQTYPPFRNLHRAVFGKEVGEGEAWIKDPHKSWKPAGLVFPL